ncbi:MAG: hypothetical protein GXP49_05445 [Deltaproteobacteria bacterium]|nr:hypothetical protein [Deltaproteobacteria bacterium]
MMGVKAIPGKLLLFVAVSAFVSACAGGQPVVQGPPVATFVLLGDTRPVGTGVQPYAFQELVDMVAREKPLAVFHTGDIIDGYGLDKQDSIASYKEFKRVASGFGVPVYAVPGDHDVFDVISEDLFKTQVGPLYRSVEISGCAFILLNTETPGAPMRLDSEQYKWLETELKKFHQTTRQIFIVMHRPLWPVDGQKGNSLDAYRNHRDYLVGLFKKYGVRFVFTGHEHLYAKVEKDGITQFITGGGGAPLDAEESEGGYNHFIVVTVTGPFPETPDSPARPVEVKIHPVRVSDPVSVALENIHNGEPVLSFDIIKRARGMNRLQNHPDVKIVLGITHMAIGEMATGRDMIGEVISRRPGSALTAGNMLMYMGWPREAATVFMAGIKKKPRDPLLYEGMAEAWFKLGNRPNAVKALISAAKINRRYANPYYRLMNFYLKDEKPDKAKKAAANFVKIRPFGRRASKALKLLNRKLPRPPPPGTAGNGR